jgi:hypothetical protein
MRRSLRRNQTKMWEDGKMAEYEWTCAGCGIPSPNKMRSCDCPTNVVCWDRKHEWKRDTIEDAKLTAAIRLVKANGYTLTPSDGGKPNE